MSTNHGTGDDVPTVSVRNVSKVYGSDGSGVTALDDVSFEIEAGSVTGILGPNGAGKTTLIKCVLGLVKPSRGTVRVNGSDVYRQTRSVHSDVAAVLEGSRNVYWRLSVIENMRFFASVSGNDPTERRDFHENLLDRFGLAHKRTTPVRELSRGQKQKASIVCALAREPEVVFLDEPTLGLDVTSSLNLRSELDAMARNRGYTIVISSHDMDVIQDICDRVHILIDGELTVSATVDELLDRFGVQTYEVTTAESLSREQKRVLRDTIGVRDFTDRRGATRFEFETDRNRFYDTIAELEACGVTPERLEAVEPDLAEVFVDITDREPSETPKPEVAND